MSIRTIPAFQYHAPTTVKEAIVLLDDYGAKAKILAGGTDVIPKMKGGILAPEHIISLRDVKELSYVKYDSKNGLAFGATVTLRELETNPVVQKTYPALYHGAHSIASTQIRNVGTIVGNICNAVPSADCAPALLVLGAKLKVVSVNGERIIPIEKFFVGVCKTVLADNELVTEVQLPVPAVNSGNMYYPFNARKALDLAVVGVAVSITSENGVCKDAKIALGAVEITPVRARKAEAILIGQCLMEDIIEKAALCASTEECHPISDLRASKEYRREMVRVLTRDAINASQVK